MVINLYFHPNQKAKKDTIALIGLTDSVTVIKNIDGVTGIKCSNVEDQYFTLGYLTAQDQLYHLTMLAAAARGNLSSIFGLRALKTDQFIHLIGIPSEAEAVVSLLTPDLQLILQQYCNGINRYIDSISKLQFPSELKRLNAKPIKWRPSDIIACQNLLAIKTQSGLFQDLFTSSISEFYSREKINELINPLQLSLNPSFEAAPTDQLYEVIVLTNEIETSFFEFLGNHQYDGNNLVIRRNHTRNKKPMLMALRYFDTSDPFIGENYQIEYPGTIYTGIFFPGLPFPMIGRNQATAWATATFLELEFLNVPINQYDRDVYLYNAEWHTMELNEIVIPVRGEKPFTLKYRSTDQGPVISDLIKGSISDDIVIMKTTAPPGEQAINLLNNIINSSSGSDIVAAVSSRQVANLSTLYADTLGNIGFLKSAKAVNQSEKILAEATINPRKNFIIADPIINWIKNNQEDTNGDNEAITKIETLIKSAEPVTKEEMLKELLKLGSVYNVMLSKRIVDLCSTINDREIEYALQEMGGWDGESSAKSTGAVIFNATLKHLIVNIYQDELDLLGEELFWAFKNIPEIQQAGVWTALHINDYSWTDNIQTVNEIETISELVALSLREAVREIQKDAGGVQYGKFWNKSYIEKKSQTYFFDLSEDLISFHFEIQPSLILIPEK